LDLIEDIESLILKYKERINLLETNKNKEVDMKSDKKIKSFDKQIEFHAKKEQEIKEQRKKNENEERIEKDFRKNKNFAENEDNLIERVKSELQIQKFNILNEHLKSQEEVKNIEKKKKHFSGLLEVFEKVKDEAIRIIEKNSENNSKKDTESMIKKIEQEQKDFDINTLKNIENILPDSDSLIGSINKSTENLK